MYQYVHVHICSYQYVLVHTRTCWYVLPCTSFNPFFTRFSSSILLLIKRRKDLVSTVYPRFQILVQRFKRFWSHAWIGIWQPVIRKFLNVSCQTCSRWLSTCLISCRKICQIRLVKRPNGISRRHTVFYTRSVRLCNNFVLWGTLTTHRVKPQRYVPVHTSTYQYVQVRTSIYWYWMLIGLYSMPI